MNKINPWTQFGLILATGKPAGSLNQELGFATKMASADALRLKRMTLSVAADCIEFSNDATTPASRHLKLASASKDWSSHHDDLMALITAETISSEIHAKLAFSDVASAAGLAARGAGYGTLLGGAGLGALYTVLSQHSQQDAAKNEALQAKIDHYRRLGANMNRAMQDKHHYEAAASEKPNDTREQRPDIDPVA